MRVALALMLLVGACADERAGADVDVVTATDATAETRVDIDAPEVDAPEVGVDVDAVADADVDVAGPDDADVASDVHVDAVVPVDWPMACAVGDGGTVPVPEASGAVLLDDGRVLVAADSGNDGRAAIVDLATGDAVALTLPLADAGDDIEDLTRAPDGIVWGLSSAGWLHAWRVTGDQVERVNVPTPIADEGDWRCAIDGVNCAANFEGFCLHPNPTGHCVGWAASKARGVIACVVADNASYRLDPSITVAIAPADQLSGCAFEPVVPHRLVVAGNLYSESTLWLVDPEAPTATPFEAKGIGNQEAVLVTASGVLYSFGDLQDILSDASPYQSLVCSQPGGALP